MKRTVCAALALILLAAVTFSAFASEESPILRLDMKEKPEKTEYLKGEELDLTDLYIVVTYENGATENVKITADMISGYDAESTGAQVITVTYKGRSTTFSVKVVSEYGTAETERETIEFDTSPETHAESEKEGKPSIVIIVTAVTAATAAAAFVIVTIIKKPKEDEK